MGENLKQFAEVKNLLSDIAAEKADWQRAAGESIGEIAAGWIAPHYLSSVRERLIALPEGPERFKLLRLAVADAMDLQRGGHAGDWLQLERDRLEFHRQKHRDTLAAAQTELQKLRDPKLPLSDADRQAIVDKADEILGLK